MPSRRRVWLRWRPILVITKARRTRKGWRARYLSFSRACPRRSCRRRYCGAKSPSSFRVGRPSEFDAVRQSPNLSRFTYGVRTPDRAPNQKVTASAVCYRPLASAQKAGILRGINHPIPAPMPLTDTKCRTAKAAVLPYKLTDTKGLHIEVRPSGAKLWRYRYRIAGKENLFALGEYVVAPAGETEAQAKARREDRRFTLDEARQERARARALVKQGTHPAHARMAQRHARLEANENTFEFVAREWLAVKTPKWSSRRARQVESVLTSRVFPRVGKLPIDSITARQMIHVVKKIADDGAPTIAQLAWNISAKVFVAAKKTGHIKASPISDLTDVIPIPAVQHKKPLERRDIPKLCL